MDKFSEEDKTKINELINLLRGEIGEDDSELDFLCTHCHCKVCSTAKNEKNKNKE